MNTKPQRFKNFTEDIHSIINASEIFIKKPENPDDQKNTLKVPISVTPNSFINFVSKAYKDAVSDKKLTRKSQYLEKLPMYSTSMADKDFNIEGGHIKWSHLNLLRQKKMQTHILAELVI